MRRAVLQCSSVCRLPASSLRQTTRKPWPLWYALQSGARYQSAGPVSSVSSSSQNDPLDVSSEKFEAYGRSYAFPSATQDWQKLAELRDGSEIVLHGYVGARKKVSKHLIFQRLQSPDLKHDIQLVCTTTSDTDGRLMFPAVAKSSRHSPVCVRGTLKHVEASVESASGGVNSMRHLEIEVLDSVALNAFPSEVMLTADKVYVPEQRHLEIRASPMIRSALQARSEAASIVRNTFLDHGFLEVETPILFKSTPEGAREFLVPTRQKFKAYALPQSPQQYKQILMASGVPRYFQIARCFRDEDLRVDRQPEFTQIDYEMAFADEEAIKSITEQVISKLWQRFRPEHKLVPGNIPAISYKEAMDNYGSDKPDRRYGMKIANITTQVEHYNAHKSGHRVEMLKLKLTGNYNLSQETISANSNISRILDKGRQLMESSTYMKGPDRRLELFQVKSSDNQPLRSRILDSTALDSLQVESGDIVMLLSEPETPRAGGWTTMGRLRDQLHRFLVDQKLLPASTGFDFLWIVDFPLFSPTVDSEPGQGGQAGLAATHHPFTAPKTTADLALLATDPTSAIAAHYDLVVNGVELGGGSRRIHHGDVQEYILRNVLRVPESGIASLQHLIDALKLGCPPHAGMALGFDRLLAVMLGHTSVRHVIAFPKNNRGEDLMVGSPNVVQPDQLKPYHLQSTQ